jgi:hypothetical protein
MYTINVELLLFIVMTVHNADRYTMYCSCDNIDCSYLNVILTAVVNITHKKYKCIK